MRVVSGVDDVEDVDLHEAKPTRSSVSRFSCRLPFNLTMNPTTFLNILHHATSSLVDMFPKFLGRHSHASLWSQLQH